MGISIDLNVGDIRHPISGDKNVGLKTVIPISISESIPISDIEEKIIPSGGFEPAPLEKINKCYTSKLRCLSFVFGMLDIRSEKKLSVGLRSLSPISGSVRYR